MKLDKQILHRGLTILLSTLFFAYFPLILFLIYMAEGGFFSYDFFADGVFGLQVFFLVSAFLFVFISLVMFGWIIPIVGWYRTRTLEKTLLILSVLAAVYVSVMVFPKLNIREAWGALMYIGVVGAFVSFHIANLAYAEPAFQLRSLVGVIVIVVGLSLQLREEASSILSMGLREFGVGGGLEVELTPELGDDSAITGRLILLSPDHIYLTRTQSSAIEILARTRFDVIETRSAEPADDSSDQP